MGVLCKRKVLLQVRGVKKLVDGQYGMARSSSPGRGGRGRTQSHHLPNFHPPPLCAAHGWRQPAPVTCICCCQHASQQARLQHSGVILIHASMLDNCVGRSRFKQPATVAATRADLPQQSHDSNWICSSQYGAKQQALRPAPAIGKDELGHKGSEDAPNDHPRTCQEKHLQGQCWRCIMSSAALTRRCNLNKPTRMLQDGSDGYRAFGSRVAEIRKAPPATHTDAECASAVRMQKQR